MKRFFAFCFCVLLIVTILLVSSPSYATTNELSLNEHQKNTLLKFTRKSFNQSNTTDLSLPTNLDNIKNPIIIMLFDKEGRLLGNTRIDEPSKLSSKIKKATSLLKKNNPDKKGYLHIMMVSYTARFANLGTKGLFDYKVYEPQLMGIAYEWEGKRTEINPVETTMYDLDSKGVRHYLAKKLGMNPKKMIAHNDLIIEIYKVLHFGETYPKHAFASFQRGQKVFQTSQVTYSEIEKRLKLIGEWYKNNVIDGEVTYEYAPSKATYNNKTRTMVRSTMAVWILNKLAYHLNDPELKKLGKETLNFYLERYFNMTHSLAKGVLSPTLSPTKKGEIPKYRFTTAGFLILSYLERGEFKVHEKEIKLLVDWLMKHQRPDGIFWTQYADSQYFMPGHLLTAIAHLYDTTKDKKYKTFFDRSFSAYKKQLQAMFHLGNERYAPFAPAWFTKPFTKMYLTTKEQKYKKMIFEINDRVSKWYDMNAKDQKYDDYDGILAPDPGSYGNTAITAAVLESLVDAAHVAKINGDRMRFSKYSFIIKKTTSYLMRLQYTPANTYYISHKERVIGGFKSDLINNKIWMDNVWHLTSAFIKTHKERLLP